MRIRRFAVLAAAGLGLAAGSALADGHMAWTKSQHGDDDQAGSSNLMTPKKAR